MAQPPLSSFVGTTPINAAAPKPDLSSFVGTPQQTPPPQQEPNPMVTFPASGNESPIVAGAKTLGNMPSSALNFAKGTIQTLNPLEVGSNLASYFKGFGDYSNELQQGGDKTAASDAVLNVLKEVPGQAYKQLVPQFVKSLLQGDTQGAEKAIVDDPVGQIAPLIIAGKALAEGAGVGDKYDTAVSNIASPVTKTAGAIGGGIANAAGGATEFIAGQATGINPSTLKTIVSNPEKFSQEAQSTITRGALASEIQGILQQKQNALSETGNEYGGIRTGTQPIPVNSDYLTNLIQDKTGLTVDDSGNLQTSGSASIRNPSDVNALQSKLFNVWNPEFQKGYLTPNEFLNFRNDLSKMAYNDNGIGKSTPLSNLAEIMRGQANTDLRPNVPGLENLDTKFAPAITELNNISKGLIDKDGNLTDSAINRIANATGKGKDLQLARLEQIDPGITDKIKILKATEDLNNATREQKVGTYTRAAVLGSALYHLNPYFTVAAILSIPQVAVPLLRGLGYSAEAISNVTNTLGISKATSALNNAPQTLAAPAMVESSTNSQ